MYLFLKIYWQLKYGIGQGEAIVRRFRVSGPSFRYYKNVPMQLVRHGASVAQKRSDNNIQYLSLPCETASTNTTGVELKAASMVKASD